MTSGELAYDDYMAGCKQKEIAAKYNVSINTVKSWYNRIWKRWKVDGHQSAAEAAGAEMGARAEKVCTPKEKSVHTKKGAHRDAADLDKAMLESVEANEELNDERGLFCYFVAAGYSDVKAYMNAYKCSYENARRHAYILRKNEEVNAEIARLKEIVVTCGDVPTASEVMERYAKLFYAKPSDFIDYGTEERETEEGATTKRNYLRFKDPSQIDEEIISSVALGKDGAKIEIPKDKALDFLAKWHELNPMDRHKKAYDEARLELERKKADKPEESDDKVSKLLSAMKKAAQEARDESNV